MKKTSHLKLQQISSDSPVVQWTLLRDGVPIVTDVAPNARAAREAARRAFAEDLCKKIPDALSTER